MNNPLLTKKPFYKKGWFWLIIGLIIIIVIVVINTIEMNRRLEEVVEDAFYESGKGGTKITDIADDFEKTMETIANRLP